MSLNNFAQRFVLTTATGPDPNRFDAILCIVRSSGVAKPIFFEQLQIGAMDIREHCSTYNSGHNMARMLCIYFNNWSARTPPPTPATYCKPKRPKVPDGVQATKHYQELFDFVEKATWYSIHEIPDEIKSRANSSASALSVIELLDSRSSTHKSLYISTVDKIHQCFDHYQLSVDGWVRKSDPFTGTAPKSFTNEEANTLRNKKLMESSVDTMFEIYNTNMTLNPEYDTEENFERFGEGDIT